MRKEIFNEENKKARRKFQRISVRVFYGMILGIGFIGLLIPLRPKTSGKPCPLPIPNSASYMEEPRKNSMEALLRQMPFPTRMRKSPLPPRPNLRQNPLQHRLRKVTVRFTRNLKRQVPSILLTTGALSSMVSALTVPTIISI